MVKKTIGGISVKKIKEIDKRANDTKKKTNEKPLKVNMEMDELAQLLLRTKNKKEKKSIKGTSYKSGGSEQS